MLPLNSIAESLRIAVLLYLKTSLWKQGTEESPETAEKGMGFIFFSVVSVSSVPLLCRGVPCGKRQP